MWYIVIGILLTLGTFIGGLIYLRNPEHDLLNGALDRDDLQEIEGLGMWFLVCLFVGITWIALLPAGALVGLLILVRNLILGKEED